MIRSELKEAITAFAVAINKNSPTVNFGSVHRLQQVNSVLRWYAANWEILEPMYMYGVIEHESETQKD